jgi:AbrB family looped-hinge helix DNA binding protein
MHTLTLSPAFEVIIPKHLREAMHLCAGTAMQVTQYGGRIELIPVKPMQDARGMLKGLNTDFERE